MKCCPKCKVEYIDNTLEFCLEDGSRLISPTAVSPANVKTVLLSDFPAHQPINEFQQSKETVLQNKDTNKFIDIKVKATSQGIKILEVAPIVLSLSHNYWQWLYLNKNTYSDTLSFLTSSHFVVWLILLVVGAIASFAGLRYGKNKGFAITSLVILAINLLLSIVPNK